MSDGGRTIVVNERYFGESGSGPGQFKMPRFICTLPNGNICVSDFLNQRLQILTPSGRWKQRSASKAIHLASCADPVACFARGTTSSWPREAIIDCRSSPLRMERP